MSLEHSYINTSFRFQKSNLFWTVRVYHPKEYIRSNIMNRIYVSGRGKDFLDSAENDRFTNGMIVFYEHKTYSMNSFCVPDPVRFA